MKEKASKFSANSIVKQTEDSLRALFKYNPELLKHCKEKKPRVSDSIIKHVI